MIGGIGMQELLVILVIALVIFGGKKLPEIGSNLGKAIRGFKESSEKQHDETQRKVRSGNAEPPVKEAQTGAAAMEEEEGEDPKKASA